VHIFFVLLHRPLTAFPDVVNLVNMDQLEILATLRESVNEDKAGLEAEVVRLEKQIKDLSDKNRLQLEQINGLLLEKVNMQTEGIGQREKMLQRERDIGDLRAAMSGRDLPEDIKSRILGQHEDNIQLQEQIKTLNDKLLKAKQFIKQQDKLAREEYGKSGSGAVMVRTDIHWCDSVVSDGILGNIRRFRVNLKGRARCSQRERRASQGLSLSVAIVTAGS
jgi:protein HOOK3